MNAKIERVSKDIQKIKDKINEFQSKLRELEKQKTELENMEIVDAVRGMEVHPQKPVIRFLNVDHTSIWPSIIFDRTDHTWFVLSF